MIKLTCRIHDPAHVTRDAEVISITLPESMGLFQVGRIVSTPSLVRSILIVHVVSLNEEAKREVVHNQQSKHVTLLQVDS